MKVMTHQELLDYWISSRRSVIHEWSSNIRFECRKLERMAKEYARVNGLRVSDREEVYGIYYDDLEQDTEIAAQLEWLDKKETGL